MKSQILMVVAMVSLGACATTNQNAYAELDACPTQMTEEQHQSGVVRCRAMCSSYARDFAEFDAECKCRCAPASGPGAGGGYRARPKAQPWSEGQTLWIPPGNQPVTR